MVSQGRNHEHPLSGKISGKVPHKILYPGWKRLIGIKSGWTYTLIQDVGYMDILLRHNG